MEGRDLTPEQRERGKLDLLRFTALNALSFEVLAGQILILFARQVGASLADIGLLSALLPFASIIQLGVAPLVARFGPRSLMLVGWGARTAVAAALFAVPVVSAHSGRHAATHVLLMIMGAFYFCRALGMSSWLPMVQEIVLPEDRGLYLSQQERLRQASIVLIAVVTAVYLIGAQGVTRFLHMIGIGVIAAASSLFCLWRVPDVGSMAETMDREYLHRAMAPARDPVFRRYLLFSCVLRMLLSAYTPFITVFLNEGLHLTSSLVIATNTVGSVGAIGTLGAWGRSTDRSGAKPILAISIAGVAGGLLLWFLVPRGNAATWPVAALISLVLGIFTGGLTVSMSKFELGFIPIEGRAHYVALNVTAVGMTSGFATLGAGRLLQLLHHTHGELGPFTADRYRIFFALCALLFALPWLVRRFLPEERARSLRSVLRQELRRRSARVRRLLDPRS